MEVRLEIRKQAFNDIYFPLLSCRKRYLHLYGGGGSGKSYAVAQLIITRLLSEPNRKFLIVRKVGRTIRNSCFALLLSVINDWQLQSLFRVTSSRLEIESLNGGSIICSGIDDVEKLKSIYGVTDIWIEEATEITSKDFDQLDLRLRGTFVPYFQMILTYNPINFYHWLKKEFHEKSYSIASDGRGRVNDSTVILKTTFRDNRFLDAAYIETTLQRLKEKDALFYGIYGEGDWMEPEGLIFPRYKVIATSEMKTDGCFYGLDFGYNNPSSLVQCTFADENLVQVRELFYKKGMLTRDIISHMQSLGISRRSFIYADAANPDKIEEIRRAGFNILPAKKDVMAGIGYVQGFDIQITEDSVNGIAEMNLYKYEVARGEITETPLKMYDHFCDAMRYAIFTHGKTRGTKNNRTTTVVTPTTKTRGRKVYGY